MLTVSHNIVPGDMEDILYLKQDMAILKSAIERSVKVGVMIQSDFSLFTE